MQTFLLLMTWFLAALAIFFSPSDALAQQSPAAKCSQAGNDDTIRPFDPALRAGFLKAHKLLFPEAKDKPDDAELKTASYRCMDGHLLACFVGANLPCGKLDTSKENKGATAFCKQNPKADTVPMSATGHDTIYFFTCFHGSAKVKEQNWKVDRRAFGVELWKPMD